MRAIVEGAGVELAYEEMGRGASVLLVHDMACDARGWALIAESVADRARVVAYDRRGYGASGAPEPYQGTTVYEQSEDAATLIEQLELAPTLVCGAGFGALVALDLAVRHARLVSGLLCVEPPLYAFVPEATEVLAAERETLREITQEHGPQAAVDRWRRSHACLSLPPAGVEPVADHRAFFADFAGLSTWPVTRAQLRGLRVPVGVLTGATTPAHLLAAADALSSLLPAPRRRRDGDLMAAIRGLIGGQ